MVESTYCICGKQNCNKSEKHEWVFLYIHQHGKVDMLNSHFVDAYIEKFKASFKPTNFGAYKCSELSSILNELYRNYRLIRDTYSLGEIRSGFPKWIYVYRINL